MKGEERRDEINKRLNDLLKMCYASHNFKEEKEEIEKPCPVCHGRGTYVSKPSTYGFFVDSPAETQQCLRCKGTGVI